VRTAAGRERLRSGDEAGRRATGHQPAQLVGRPDGGGVPIAVTEPDQRDTVAHPSIPEELGNQHKGVTDQTRGEQVGRG